MSARSARGYCVWTLCCAVVCSDAVLYFAVLSCVVSACECGFVVGLCFVFFIYCFVLFFL